MNSENLSDLETFRKRRELFVGIDSDGCAFDTMEVKHKECFVPEFIERFDLRGVSSAARDSWEFVNLYSQNRGTNRFKGLIASLELLRRHPETARTGTAVPELPALRRWIDSSSSHGNPALEATINEAPADSAERSELEQVLAWSKAVNKRLAVAVRNIPPFRYVRESLDRLHQLADLVVVSQSIGESLRREWREHDLHRYVSVIAGQEQGTKEEHLRRTVGDRYGRGRVLVVGDAPGDLRAARSVAALFFPILPGREQESWKRFYTEGIDRFCDGSFPGTYEAELLASFESVLPERPDWL